MITNFTKPSKIIIGDHFFPLMVDNVGVVVLSKVERIVSIL